MTKNPSSRRTLLPLTLSAAIFATPALSVSPIAFAANPTPFSAGASNALPETTNAKGFLKNGETVAWIGAGFVERMQQSNWVDVVLTAADPSLKFRNIGWSGDTVFGDARGVFGGREDGFKRLLGDLDKTDATVAFVTYGDNECREGDEGLADFEKGYRRLLAELANRNIRVALILPRAFEGSKVPNAELWNKHLATYNAKTREIAADLNLPVVDFEKFKADQELTTDGIYWTDEGYRMAGLELAQQLGLELNNFWKQSIEENPQSGPLSSYRDLVRQKNEWFFHFHRPQNETYLFLFRKHEQGNNAAELEQILPEIEKLEGQIREAFSTASDAT